jgi:hypothetical protein
MRAQQTVAAFLKMFVLQGGCYMLGRQPGAAEGSTSNSPINVRTMGVFTRRILHLDSSAVTG